MPFCLGSEIKYIQTRGQDGVLLNGLLDEQFINGTPYLYLVYMIRNLSTKG